MSSPRFVFDTNTIVSALILPESIPRRAFDGALERGKILLSMPTLLELSGVLTRQKFDKYLLDKKGKEFLAALVRQAAFVEITEEITDCRDPKDNKFLELAACGAADYLITGDSDLLELNSFRGIRILQPRDLLDTF